MNAELETALRALADAQRALADAKHYADDCAAVMWNTEAGRAAAIADGILIAARATTIVADEVARAAILAEYETTGDKTPAPGAGVRVAKCKLTITDTDLALAWAEEHMPAAVLKTVDADLLLAAWADRQSELPTWMQRTPDKAMPTIASNLAELYPAEAVGQKQ